MVHLTRGNAEPGELRRGLGRGRDGGRGVAIDRLHQDAEYPVPEGGRAQQARVRRRPYARLDLDAQAGEEVREIVGAGLVQLIEA